VQHAAGTTERRASTFWEFLEAGGEL